MTLPEMVVRRLQAAVVVLLLSASYSLASPDGPLRPLKTDTPPVIDGELDDEVWASAPYVTGFQTWNPDFGQDMVEQTEAYYAYDQENLYFAFRCFDSQPDKIKSSVTGRDQMLADDWMAINLDSFNDQQSLYAFYVNPAGIQADTRYAAGTEDPGFDTVWYSAGRIDETGYTVEVQIPFKSIRFSDAEPVEMGVIFERNITRHSQMGTYPALDPAKGGDFQTEMWPMLLEGVEHYTLFELLPAFTHAQRKALEQGQLLGAGDQTDLSLTVKYGITSELILDAAVNPDFSQVEADAGQIDINLRNPLFFPEKRSFFFEGREYFNFAGPADASDPLRAVVYTRSIVDPQAGVKLSGKLGRRNTFAAIVSRDELPEGSLPGGHSDFVVFRYKRSLRGDSYVGGFYTGKQRGDGYNRVFGLDGAQRLGRSSRLGYHAFRSRTVDEASSSPSEGHAVGADYDYRTRSLHLYVGALDVSEGFRTETGHLGRQGVSRAKLYVSPRLYPDLGAVQRLDVEGFTEHTRDTPSGLWESSSFLTLRLVLPRRSSIAATYTRSSEIFLGEEFDTSGVRLSARSQITKKLYWQVTLGKGPAIFYSADPYQGRSHGLSATLRYQPSEKVEARIDQTYSSFTRESDEERIYDYGITRAKLTYQVNKYLLFQGILEYNSFREEMESDFLVSFLYIPGTVVHLGYGSLYEKLTWREGAYVPADRFLESRRGIFFKASYLWRM
jgi:hypothetical protein